MSKGAVLTTLERTDGDGGFFAHFTEAFTDAVKCYDLTWQEFAKLSSSDVCWIDALVGK